MSSTEPLPKRSDQTLKMGSLQRRNAREQASQGRGAQVVGCLVAPALKWCSVTSSWRCCPHTLPCFTVSARSLRAAASVPILPASTRSPSFTSIAATAGTDRRTLRQLAGRRSRGRRGAARCARCSCCGPKSSATDSVRAGAVQRGGQIHRGGLSCPTGHKCILFPS